VKVFVDWVLAQRARLIIVAIVAAPLLSVVAGGLIALETARRDALRGVVSGAGVIAGLALLAVVARSDAALLGTLGLVCVVTGVASGELIRRAGNLALAVQTAMVICSAVVLVVGLTGIDARPFFAGAVDEFVTLLPSGLPPEQVEQWEQRAAAALFTTAVFLQLIGPVLLGSWWTWLAAGQRRFGHEFRELKLGRLLGSLATVLFVLGLVFPGPVVQNLALLGVLGFLLQGVAVMHAWAHAKRWHPALLVPLYLLMLVPGPNVLIVLPIGMAGLVDQWFDLRASLRSRT
jgi:hypothetical protein